MKAMKRGLVPDQIQDLLNTQFDKDRRIKQLVKWRMSAADPRDQLVEHLPAHARPLQFSLTTQRCIGLDAHGFQDHFWSKRPGRISSKFLKSGQRIIALRASSLFAEHLY